MSVPSSTAWRAVALALVLGGAAVLPACGSGDDGSPRATGDGPVTLDRAGELVFSYDGFPPNLDPHKNGGGNQTTPFLVTYDRLIHLTPEGEFEPGLATEWQVADDGLSMELTLRPDVVFHDGTPFDAEAVRASLERPRTLEGANAGVAANSERITAVEPVGEDGVRLTFSEPYYSVEYDLALQLGAMISPAALEAGVDLDSEDAGAGPYRLASWQPGQSAVYERFEEYWDPEANPLARLEIRNLADSQTRLSAVRSGQADLVALEARRSSEAESAGLVVNSYETLGSYDMFVNAERLPEWQDEQVRLAVQHAVDREGLTEAITGGVSDPAVQPLVASHPAYNPDYPGDYFEHDPERARELLAEAGADDLSIDVVVLNRPEDVAIAEALQAQLDEVGITLDLEVTEPQNFTLYTGGNAQALIGTWAGRLNAVETLEGMYLPGGSLNPGDWAVPGLEEAVAEARSLPLGEARDEATRAAFGIAAEQGAQLTFYTLVTSWTSNDCVAGFEPYAGTAPDLRRVGIRQGCA